MTLDEAFKYLDRLRESGRSNMWLAASYLERERDIERAEASRLFRLWKSAVTRFDNAEGESRSMRVEWAEANPDADL